ncbi:hypothetical protein VTN00DRAFT_2646 [Thermoascus crustaceus]|uniref:uncharacterized protein n=1 Tax=Thermoascus crustaceus TaxID=5088 RepID=UPI0037429256
MQTAHETALGTTADTIHSSSDGVLTELLAQSGSTSSSSEKTTGAGRVASTEFSTAPPLLPWGLIAMQNESPPGISSRRSLQGINSASPRTNSKTFGREFMVRSPSLEQTGLDADPKLDVRSSTAD